MSRTQADSQVKDNTPFGLNYGRLEGQDQHRESAVTGEGAVRGSESLGCVEGASWTSRDVGLSSVKGLHWPGSLRRIAEGFLYIPSLVMSV